MRPAVLGGPAWTVGGGAGSGSPSSGVPGRGSGRPICSGLGGGVRSLRLQVGRAEVRQLRPQVSREWAQASVRAAVGGVQAAGPRAASPREDPGRRAETVHGVLSVRLVYIFWILFFERVFFFLF